MGLDPVAPNPENIHSFNRYAYANNNPYKFVDPDGRLPIFIPIVAALLFEGGNLALESAYDSSNPCGDCVRSSGVAIPSGPVAISGYKVGKALGQPVVRAEPEVALPQVIINQAAGAAFERQIRELMEQTHSEVVSQVTVRTKNGIKTRIDLMARDASGKIVCVECKASATAPLTKNQSKAFPEIE